MPRVAIVLFILFLDILSSKLLYIFVFEVAPFSIKLETSKLSKT